MDHAASPGDEGAAKPDVDTDATDFTDDLARLAVVEAELATAEADLEALESSATPPLSE